MTEDTLVMDIDDLGLDTSIFDIFDDKGAFAPSSRQFDLQLNSKVPFVGTLGSKTYECEATLLGAELGRISLVAHTIKDAGGNTLRDTKIATGTFRNVRMNVTIDLGQGQVPLVDVLLAVINNKRKDNPVAKDEFVKLITTRLQMPLVPLPEYGITGGMAMLWQHFSPTDESVEALFDLILRNGGVELPPPAEGRITRVAEIPRSQDGLPVNLIEVGRQDRSAGNKVGKLVVIDEDTVPYPFEGNGFLDFVDAVYSNFERSVSLRKTYRAMDAQLAQLKDDNKGKAPTEEIVMMGKAISAYQRMSTSWMSNWGGAARRLQENADQSLSYVDRVDPIQVPCGRVVVQDRSQVTDENPDAGWTDISLWQTREETEAAEGNEAAGGVIDTTGTAEEPF